LELGLAATEYIESGASTGKAGLLENEPRFDYSGGASCPSLLLEPSRTNLIEQSEYFNGSDWSRNNTSVIDNAIISPEGLLNGSKFIQDEGTTDCNVRTQDTINVVSGDIYTFSVFAKKGEFDKIQLDFSDSRFGDTYVIANLTNGTLTAGTDNTDEGIEDYGNGWYRVYVVGTAIATGTTARIFRLDNNGEGDGSKGIYAYGAQIEEGSYPTSYIPNHSGGSVTREADDCGGAGTSSTFNDDEGVLFIELETTKNSSPAQITINDGTYSNRVIFEVRPDAAFIKALINSGGTNVYDTSVASAPNTNYKVAIKYSANDIAFFVNGVKEASTTTRTAMPTGLNDLSFTGKENDGALRFLGNIKQTLIFPEALPDNQCIALTS
jgi:hypothetical protein